MFAFRVIARTLAMRHSTAIDNYRRGFVFLRHQRHGKRPAGRYLKVDPDIVRLVRQMDIALQHLLQDIVIMPPVNNIWHTGIGQRTFQAHPVFIGQEITVFECPK